MGMNIVAITGHGSIKGWNEFHREPVKQGIKVIMGIEAYEIYS